MLGEEPDPRDLMRPFPTDLMRMWRISTRINKPENDDVDARVRAARRPNADARLRGVAVLPSRTSSPSKVIL
jgi:hypothetical protein